MELEKFIDRFGLSEYEKKAYTTLLITGKSKSKELSKKSGVSYGRIYEILEKLESKGLISVIDTEPKMFEAIEPKIAFNLLIKKQEEELLNLKSDLDKLKIPIKKRIDLEEDKTIILQGKRKQIAMINDMHERAKREILMIPGIYAPNASRKKATLKALQNDVKIRRLIRNVHNENKEILNESIKLGEEVRFNNLKGLRLIVTDEKEAMISIVNPDTKDRISIYTSNKDFARSMASFFNSIWKSSKSYKLD